MTEALDDDEIKERLEDHEIWGVFDGRLVTEIEFENYKETVFFANAVFSLAEQEMHHPKVTVNYDSVAIDLWSHEEEGITEKDFELAEKIEEKVREIRWS